MSVDYVDRRHTQTEDRYAADDLETMQGAKRYANHLFELFRPYVGRRVLEIGCGIGTMSAKLAATADVVLGIEPNRSCAVRVLEHMQAEPRFSLRECLLEDCDPVELASHRFDTMLCVNVLEHIQDDVAALMLNAHVGKSTTHSPSQIKLFETLVAPWALPLDRLIPPPVGLSLVAVGRRSR